MIIDQEKLDELKLKQPLGFEDILFCMKSGKSVFRMKWKGAFNIRMFIDRNKVGAKPGFVCDDGASYEITQEDIFAEDWLMVT